MDMLVIQDEPYTGVIEILDDQGVALPIPAGDLRMHLRTHYSTTSPPLVDCADYLVRESTSVRIELPASVTVGLPATLVGDVWAGDVRLAQLNVTVSRSATLRSV